MLYCSSYRKNTWDENTTQIHHDIDHIGSLSSILKYLPNDVKVFAHKEEKAYIEGKKQPVKVAQLEANLGKLLEEMKIIYENSKLVLKIAKSM